MKKSSPRVRTGGRRVAWEPITMLAPGRTNVTDLDGYRQRRRESLAMQAALDHLDRAGLCACWTTPGRRHRSRQVIAPTGTGPA